MSTLLELESEIQSIRKDFPILNRKVRDGKPLIYLDNAATTQKPVQVVEAISNYYLNINSNVHRGIHALSEEASELYEKSHEMVSDFINAKFTELVFTKNTTESTNIVAYGLEDQIKKGDEIVISRLEHHSNLVPFQQLAKNTGASLKYIENENHTNLDLNSAEKVITDKTKLVAFAHVSNVLGSITPAREIIDIAHEHGALTLLDAAQSVPHMKIDVKNLDCDFMAFSGHKMLAPMGTGGLYGKEEELDRLSPLLYGGEMIRHVSFEDATWNELPWKFEAGTPNVGGSIGFGEAVKYLSNLGMDKVRQIEHQLTKYAMDRLDELDYITIYGPDIENRGGVISFNVTGGKEGVFIHPHDVASILDEEGIAIRAGHHCAQPLMRSMELPATSRMSFYIYNTKQEIDITIEALEKVQNTFN
ncbi:MAG: putative cysteine desulfurase [Candidatus Heimdallarchaeota archaeon LC_2]|nr:MAG: putative cysteine desulfurase [Candidatus Heimdallarchaeota archaeon LC_2]